MTVHLPELPDDPLVPEIEAAASRLALARRAGEIDRTREFPWVEFRGLGAAHLLGLRTPVERGGRGLSLPRVGTLLFRLAHLSGTTFAKMSLQPEFSSVLADHGSAALRQEWFDPMVRGERLVGNQITEPGAGSDAAAIQLVAERSGDGYVLTGEKSEVAFAEEAQGAIVYGVVPGAAGTGRATAFLVPQDLPGISRQAGPGDLGERWQRRGTVRYERVRIPSAQRIGDEGEGFRFVRPELTRERALLAAVYLGVGRASWEETVRYVGDRTAFGRPLAAQEAVAFPLVEDGADLDAAWLFVRRTLERLEAGTPADGDAALAKWMATEAALRAIDHAIQFHGGRGYSASYPHEQRWRDVRSGRIAHGPAEIMHIVAARDLWPRPRGESA